MFRKQGSVGPSGKSPCLTALMPGGEPPALSGPRLLSLGERKCLEKAVDKFPGRKEMKISCKSLEYLYLFSAVGSEPYADRQDRLVGAELCVIHEFCLSGSVAHD